MQITTWSYSASQDWPQPTQSWKGLVKDMMASPAVTPLQGKNCHWKRCQLTSREVEGTSNQYVRIAEVLMLYSLDPCWKLPQLKAVSSSRLSEIELECLQGWILMSSPGNLFSIWPSSQKKCLNRLSCISVCVCCLFFLSLDTTEKGMAPCSLFPLIQQLHALIRSACSTKTWLFVLQAKQFQFTCCLFDTPNP